MPNRIIRESCRSSPTLDQMSAEAERLFWRLTTVADDYGRFEADPRLLLASCFPLAVDRWKATTVAKWFGEVVASGAVVPYVIEGRAYGFFPSWEKHQRVRESKPKHPAPLAESAASCGELPQVAADCRLARAFGSGGVSSPVERSEDALSRAPQRKASDDAARTPSNGPFPPNAVSSAKEKRPRVAASLQEPARELLEYVNEIGGTHFEPVEANLRLIRARLMEVDDWTLAATVRRQWAAWKLKPEMRPYFRPKTLFAAENCAQYVGQLTDMDRAWIAKQRAQGVAS